MKNNDINKYSETLIKAFFKNNSRLISLANETIETYGNNFNKTIDLKDGVVSLDGSSLSIYGYSLGTYVEFSQYLHEKKSYKIIFSNLNPLSGIVDIEYFKLDTFAEIENKDNNNTVGVTFDGDHSSCHFEGSMELFLKWYNKTVDKKFPMSKNKNPVARFLY